MVMTLVIDKQGWVIIEEKDKRYKISHQHAPRHAHNAQPLLNDCIGVFQGMIEWITLIWDRVPVQQDTRSQYRITMTKLTTAAIRALQGFQVQQDNVDRAWLEEKSVSLTKKFLNFMEAGESGLCRLLFVYLFTFHLTINVSLLIILV